MKQNFSLRRRDFPWLVLTYWLIVATMTVPLLWFGSLLAWPPVASFLKVQSYQQGQCTILTKGIHTYSSYDQDSGSNYSQYAPIFTFSMSDASHKSFHGEGYGIDQNVQQDQQSTQAILNQYQIGKTFPCWYDAGNPSHAVLTRAVTEWVLLLPGGIMLLIGLGILVGGLILMRKFRRTSL